MREECNGVSLIWEERSEKAQVIGRKSFLGWVSVGTGQWGADDLEEQGRAAQQGSEKDKSSPMIYLEVEPIGHSGSCFR